LPDLARTADDRTLGLAWSRKGEREWAERHVVFADTMRMLTQRIGIFVNLPFGELSKLSLQKKLDEIGLTKPLISKQTA
jgi:arsenate reductase